MAFQVSPGVNVSEIDLSTVVPAVSTSTGGIAGVFRWGPINERILISSEVELARRFGKPKTGFNTETFFTAADFLAYSNALYVVRVSDGVKANIIGGSIPTENGITITNAGSGFTAVPTITFTGGAGTGATATARLEVVTAAIGDNAGTGYTAGDIVTVDLGDGVEATFTVNTIDAGNSDAVATLSILEAGAYTAISGGYDGDEVATTGGTGTGLTLDLSLGLDAIVVTSGGTGYTSNPTVVIAGDGINATATATIASTQLTAKYPGVIGDSLAIEIMTASTFATATHKGAFDSAPVGDEIHVAVIDEDGAISGVANTVLETYADLSTTQGAVKADGSNNFVNNVLNQKSEYIEVASSVDIANITPDLYSLSNGSDGSDEATASSLVAAVDTGYNLFANDDEVDVALLMQGKAVGTNGVVTAQAIQNIAESRKDCVAFISPQYSDVVNASSSAALTAIKTFKDNTSINSSYAVMDSGYKYRYDKYNDVYTWSPLNGDIAGLCARTDNVRDPWFSPAGYNRGFIKNVIKLAYNPNKASRDELYKVGINPVITQSGQGTLLFGDKTMQSKPSAFDRINVRRLFIVLEKAISTASKFTLFEFNDDFTRAQFVNLIEPFLRDVQGRRGIYDFRVVCDETNNTPDVVDTNRFVGDIYIKPARAINFIQLNFVAVRSGVEFNEIVGQL